MKKMCDTFSGKDDDVLNVISDTNKKADVMRLKHF